MGFIIYFTLGLIVACVNWFFVISQETRNEINVCISIFVGTFLWPAICMMWFYKFVDYSNNRKYPTIEN